MIRQTLSAVVIAVSMPAVAFAQTSAPASAPIPKNGTLVEAGDGTPVSDDIKAPGLPGVDFDGDGAGRGPGGLQNNVGAIGMALPSTSSDNPVPLETPGQMTLDGVPVGDGSPQ